MDDPEFGRCNSGPLWLGGRPVTADELHLDELLAEQFAAWNASYDDAKLPMEGPGDAAWLAEGIKRHGAVRAAVSPRKVLVTEPWWSEDPNE